MHGLLMNLDGLLMNDSFVQWVLDPDEPLEKYWNSWIAENSDACNVIENAKTFIKKIHFVEDDSLKEKSLLLIKERVWYRIEESVAVNMNAEDPKQITKFLKSWRQVAASLLIVAFAAVLFSLQTKKSGEKYTYKGVERERTDKCIVRKNVSKNQVKVYLPDGSEIVLEPDASITYHALLTGKKRLVTLKGNAFFDVAKDSTRPFIIHTSRADVTVLGTSFKIIDEPDNGSVTVAVRSGSVMVSNTSNLKSNIRLLPGEQVLIAQSKEVFAKKEQGDSVNFIKPDATVEQFDYDHVSVIAILKELENVYGVFIELDANDFKNCFLTTNLSSGSLYTKLNIITAAINAKYTLEGDRIHLSGGGCN
jgi:transmembrane sensor